MQCWVMKLNAEKEKLAELFKKVKDTDGSIEQVSALLKSTRADKVDKNPLRP